MPPSRLALALALACAAAATWDAASASPPMGGTFLPPPPVNTSCDVGELTRQGNAPNPCAEKFMMDYTLKEFRGNQTLFQLFLDKAEYHEAKFVQDRGNTPQAMCQFGRDALRNMSRCICPGGPCKDVVWDACENRTMNPLGNTQGGRRLLRHAQRVHEVCMGGQPESTPNRTVCEMILPPQGMGLMCPPKTNAPTTVGAQGSLCTYPNGPKRSGMCIENYNGRCAFLTGPKVFLPEGVTPKQMDEAVRLLLFHFRKLPNSMECNQAYDRMVCDWAFPQCTSASYGTDPVITEVLPRAPCQDTCQRFWHKCRPSLQQYLGLIGNNPAMSLLPNCGVNGTFPPPFNRSSDTNGGRPNTFPVWFEGAQGQDIFPAVSQIIKLRDGFSNAEVACFNVTQPPPPNRLVDMGGECLIPLPGGEKPVPPGNFTRPPTFPLPPRKVVFVCGGGGDPHYQGGNASHPNAWRADCQKPGWTLFAATEKFSVEVLHTLIPGANASVIEAMRVSAFAPDTTRLYFGADVDDWLVDSIVEKGTTNFSMLPPPPPPGNGKPFFQKAIILRGALSELRFGCNTWSRPGQDNQTVCNIGFASPDMVAGICRMGCPGEETKISVKPREPGSRMRRRVLDGDAVVEVPERSECTAAGLKEPFLSSCHFDVSSTNDAAFFVQQSLLAESSYNETTQTALETQASLPLSSGTVHVGVGVGAAVVAMVVVAVGGW